MLIHLVWLPLYKSFTQISYIFDIQCVLFTDVLQHPDPWCCLLSIIDGSIDLISRTLPVDIEIKWPYISLWSLCRLLNNCSLASYNLSAKLLIRYHGLSPVDLTAPQKLRLQPLSQQLRRNQMIQLHQLHQLQGNHSERYIYLIIKKPENLTQCY